MPVEHNFFVCNRVESTLAFWGAPVMWNVDLFIQVSAGWFFCVDSTS